jgi:predicted nucleotidyltransferase
MITHVMSTARTPLFRTVPDRDYLGFWAGTRLRAEAVVDFLEFRKADIAKIARVSLASVRFDQKMPSRVRDRLMDLATLYALVAQHFRGNVVKTALWFKTANPLLSNLSPREMLRLGRYEKLRGLVMGALEDDATSPTAIPVARVGTPEVDLKQEPSERTALPPLILRRERDIAALCRRYGVRQLALFGSILREDFDSSSSDVDVVVEFEPPQSTSAARQYFDFKRDLELLLEHPVDLVELGAMEEGRLKRIIERTKVPIYAAAA